METALIVLNRFFDFLSLLILIRILVSIFRINLPNSISVLIFELTEPLQSLARKILALFKLDNSMLDFSPILAMLILRVIYSVLVRLVTQVL